MNWSAEEKYTASHPLSSSYAFHGVLQAPLIVMCCISSAPERSDGKGEWAGGDCVVWRTRRSHIKKHGARFASGRRSINLPQKQRRRHCRERLLEQLAGLFLPSGEGTSALGRTSVVYINM